ncbi:Proprotein convertase subtilisin/kexin type 5 [Liparis tanakae]|uniref:Proprotein convertase subtilisin/kexin type 5 n=1 Tax=Liparis tanakae TaxID=230148 RepID=A0A4Z2IF41_9TELE|nr:Proprotein convertase subtilisin/kexin type 5 [Liparis tanakae]
MLLNHVEHDFRLQEGQVVRTWKVGDPPEGSPQTPTPQPSTPSQQDSPQPPSGLGRYQNKRAIPLFSEVLSLGVKTSFPVCGATIFTNNWAVRIRGDPETVDRIAERHGFTNMGQIGDLKSYYSFRHHATAKRSTESNKEVSVGVAQETKVEWLQQQVVLRRVKNNSGAKHLPTAHPLSTRTQPLPYNNSLWSSPWYIHCGDESKGCQSCMNVAGAWRRGYTGEGVVVSVLGDGIERERPDLKPNYDPLASYDVNGHDEEDPPPSPSNS